MLISFHKQIAKYLLTVDKSCFQLENVKWLNAVVLIKFYFVNTFILAQHWFKGECDVIFFSNVIYELDVYYFSNLNSFVF